MNKERIRDRASTLSLSKVEQMVVAERDITPFCKWHDHKFVEIVYFYKGSGEHVVDGEVYNVKNGDLFLLNAGVAHRFVGDELCKVNIMFLPQHICDGVSANNFIEEYYKKIYSGSEVLAANKNYIYLSNFAAERNESSIFNILQEYNIRGIGYERALACEVELLLVNIFRSLQEKNEKSKIQILHKEMIEKAIMFLDENIQNINKAEDVVRQIGYNTVYFNRIFTEYTGTSISHYIRKKKISFACKLLTNTSYTIERICEVVGYNDLKNFYKSFKNIMKMTPNEYRNNDIKKISEQSGD